MDNVTHAKGALVNLSGAQAVIRGGMLTRSSEASTSASQSGGNSWYVIDNHGTLEIAGGKVVNEGHFSSLIRNVGDSAAAKAVQMCIRDSQRCACPGRASRRTHCTHASDSARSSPRARTPLVSGTRRWRPQQQRRACRRKNVRFAATVCAPQCLPQVLSLIHIFIETQPLCR